MSLSEDLVNLLRSLFPSDTALKNVRLGKQKTTNVIRQALGFDYLQEMVTLLRTKLFNIIVDETTDHSTKKQLAIMATYFDVKKFEQNFLVDMIEIEDGSAAGIVTKLKETFGEMKIPMET